MKITFEEFETLKNAMFKNCDVITHDTKYRPLVEKGLVDNVINNAGKLFSYHYRVNDAGKQIVYAIIDLIENGVNEKDVIK